MYVFLYLKIKMVHFYLPTVKIRIITGTDLVLLRKKNVISKDALNTLALGMRIITLFLEGAMTCEQIMFP